MRAAQASTESSAPAQSPKVLRLPALEVRQGEKRLLYSFAVDGKALPSFAAVTRIRRDDEGAIQGYQRPEVLSHIAAIRRYLDESESPMIPNALVVAFDRRVIFETAGDVPGNDFTRHGTLVIPVDEDRKPGWIVDGQQRSAAIRTAELGSFPVLVSAFISDSDEEQRTQFILVNTTKPLPKGLVYELLPATTETLPRPLQSRRFPAILLQRLNGEERSPLYRKIQTPTTPEGVIKDNSILKALESSLSDGALFNFRERSDRGADEEQMMTVLISFWSAVKEVFDEAWGLPPRRSRLMHGVGIAGLGLLMDAIYDRYAHVRMPAKDDFAADLMSIRDVCHWTNGFWDFGPGRQRKWNELQNTSRDIDLLTIYLQAEYRARIGREPASR